MSSISVGYFPLLATIVGFFVYAKHLFSRRFDLFIIVFSSFILSIFAVSMFFYLAETLSTINLLMSQIAATAFFFILVIIANVNAVTSPPRIISDGGLPSTTLFAVALLPAPALTVGDYLVANLSPRCFGAKCAAFEFIFGSDKLFTVYYWLNTVGSTLLISSTLCAVVLIRRIKR
ncbi:hypothetical protein [Rhizobium laguerreae]|uniref:hypothetical protein n=1 Tax=Rhizobium laguerreae TaxID=1076926 RepID=UPI001C908ACD|nr:hypothetical protein [Rhizobium laguerreae]MBY3565709.1 hypothetical protein [Rhizobium laguerreae]